MKTVILIRGTSGAGKTTFAEYIQELFHSAEAEPCEICCADDYFIEKYGEYKWSAAEIFAAHVYCQNKFITALENKTELVIVANTGTKEKDIQFYLDNAKKRGYTVFSVVLENRHNGKDIHNVPEVSLQKQEKDLRNNLKLR
jgi:predicted ABC-type ATPase